MSLQSLLALFCLAIFFPHHFVYAWQSAADPSPKIVWTDGKLGLDAEHVPLAKLLEAISTQTGIEITGGEALEVRTSAHFAPVEPVQAFRELLGDYDYAVTSGPQAKTRVLIVGPAAPSKPASASAKPDPQPRPNAAPSAPEPLSAEPAPTAILPQDPGPPASLASASASAAEPAIANEQNASPENSRSTESAQQANAFQEQATQNRQQALETLTAKIQDTSQATRLQSLQLLVQSSGAGEPVVMDALRNALKDPDPAFNAFAIQTLAGYGTPTAMDALTDTFRSASASTRLLIVQSIGSMQSGLPLLQEAASDSDPDVSKAALQLLNHR